jgi:hypothetical protein
MSGMYIRSGSLECHLPRTDADEYTFKMYVWSLLTCVATKAVPKSVQKNAATTPACNAVKTRRGRLPCSNMLAVVIAWKAKDTAYNTSMARISILPGTRRSVHHWEGEGGIDGHIPTAARRLFARCDR